MHWLPSLILMAMALTATTATHYEAMQLLSRRLTGNAYRMRRFLPIAIFALVTAHLVETGIYALIFWVAGNVLHLGALNAPLPIAMTDIFYFAAETSSSLGDGDIIPTGSLRLIVSVTPLNELLLLSWSGAFLYAAVHSIERRP